ncbi:MAG TPA: folate-binding protein [Candidatus Sulfotelmatobacter sp.]|nr:folate-binding protein [Candidatus Sulfotelmatobacter sp.]
MGLTVLQEHANGLGATGEYRGATTAARFADPQAEFAAVRDGCAVYDLGYRAKISLTGADRVRWLNGMVTNNIRDLAVGDGVYAFLLNPQGRILGDLYAYNRGDSLLVDTDFSQLEKMLATFDHYIIMDDVTIKNLSTELTALGIAGPKAREVLRATNVNIPELQPLQLHTMQCDCACECLNCTLVRGDNPHSESYEVWLAPASVKPLWDALLNAGAAPVGSDALELRRIVSGIPLYGVDIRDRDLPQETEQARALNFNKGCYVGQEIVERIRSRGAVHRKFASFVAERAEESAAGIGPGDKIVAGEKEVGEITSAARVQFPAGEKSVALGYIRREIGIPGRQVAIGATSATVVQPGGLFAQPERSLEQRPA